MSGGTSPTLKDEKDNVLLADPLLEKYRQLHSLKCKGVRSCGMTAITESR